MVQEIRCEVVTAERVVYRGGADMVIAPGMEGVLGILPRHAPLLTALREGELIIRRQGEEDISIAIGGGFMEVLQNRVVVLADSAERAEEIDENRAQRARERALQQLAERKASKFDASAIESALRRSAVRLKVVQRRSRRRGGPSQPSGGSSGD
jgi:F-type H+-transporting ATPase subunit epsilon